DQQLPGPEDPIPQPVPVKKQPLLQPPPQPDRVAAALAAAAVMTAAGNDKLAEEYFTAAVKVKIPPAAALIRYGDFLAQRKKFTEAAEYYGKAAKAEPGDALALFLQGQA